MKRYVALIVTLILCCLILPVSAAMPGYDDMCADTWVTGANTYLTAKGKVELFVSLNDIADCIYVSSCKVQRLCDGSWSNVTSLPVPPAVYYNTNSYLTSCDYSSAFTKGYTYRLIITYHIDGHSVSYTSNAVSF